MTMRRAKLDTLNYTSHVHIFTIVHDLIMLQMSFTNNPYLGLTLVRVYGIQKTRMVTLDLHTRANGCQNT